MAKLPPKAPKQYPVIHLSSFYRTIEERSSDNIQLSSDSIELFDPLENCAQPLRSGQEISVNIGQLSLPNLPSIQGFEVQEAQVPVNFDLTSNQAWENCNTLVQRDPQVLSTRLTPTVFTPYIQSTLPLEYSIPKEQTSQDISVPYPTFIHVDPLQHRAQQAQLVQPTLVDSPQFGTIESSFHGVPNQQLTIVSVDLPSLDWEHCDIAQPARSKELQPAPEYDYRQRIPNWTLNCAAFAMRDSREKRERSAVWSELPSCMAKVWYRGERLDQFEYEIYFFLRYLLDGVKTDTIEVTIQSIERKFGQCNDTRKRRRIRSSLNRIKSGCEFRVKTNSYSNGNTNRKPVPRERKGYLLEITEIAPNKFQVRIPPQWKESYANGNFGWIDYQLHRTLTSFLEKALYRYIAGKQRGQEHKVQIAELRRYLGYKEGELVAWRNFVYKLEEAMATLKAKGVIQDTSIVDSLVIWRYVA